MNIRNKILTYFSVTTILLVGSVLLFIYSLFSGYREEEFQLEQKNKVLTTLKFISEMKKIDQTMVELLGSATINNMYDEKILIFDKDKTLVYSSIDDTQIPMYQNILNSLSPQRRWYAQKDGLYDVIGMYVETNKTGFFGISKANDSSGYSKLNYLRRVLIISFIAIVIVLIAVIYFLSNQITSSIIQVTRQIKDFDFRKGIQPILTNNPKDEIALLVKRFNELMERMDKAYSFQKHAVHHISHELKTPIAILVSNFEKMEDETDIPKLQEYIKNQKEDTKSLGEIINSLLEIAKIESTKYLPDTRIRVDELLFDISGELESIYPQFHYSIEYSHIVEDETQLTAIANARLIKAAFTNLMLNSLQYSDDSVAHILISVKEKQLEIGFINSGIPIAEEEKQYLFQHFFRGANSKGKRGFGLGLVLVHKILEIHKGSISYNYTLSGNNVFTVSFPLS